MSKSLSVIHTRRWPVIALSVLAVLCVARQAGGQTPDQQKAILERLDQLEKQNVELLREIKSLREVVANAQPASAAAATNELPPATAPAAPDAVHTQPLSERQDVSEHRIEELAQTKVESSQRFPVQLTGMLLVNAFTNGTNNGGFQYPTVASSESGTRNSGASLSQTILGLTYHGPQTFLGGTVSGALYMDFFGSGSGYYDHLLRLRLATIQLDWTNTTFSVGQDKPLVSRREPNSLAQVGVSPLTNAGNPWFWRPQARLEQRFALGERTTLRAEGGVYQTAENNYQSAAVMQTIEDSRPAFEARLGLRHEWGADRAIEIAPVFHTSTSHVGGESIPSRLWGVDWFVKPLPKVEISGLLFHGQNFANLGAVGGITLTPGGEYIAIRGSGGWAQLRFLATRKLSFDLYGGEQDNRGQDLLTGGIANNQGYAANVMYLVAPGVLAAFEAGQARTNYFDQATRLNNHYDLALAYLF